MMFTEVRTDPLTKVINRRGLEEALQTQFALMNRYGLTIFVGNARYRQFRVNDEQGHLEGDRILQDLAALLDEQARETDIVARYGGDEFILILPQTDFEGLSICERLRSKVHEKMPVTISGGVVAASPGDTKETLLERADAALYQSKMAGRNRVFKHDGAKLAPVEQEDVLCHRSDAQLAPFKRPLISQALFHYVDGYIGSNICRRTADHYLDLIAFDYKVMLCCVPVGHLIAL